MTPGAFPTHWAYSGILDCSCAHARPSLLKGCPLSCPLASLEIAPLNKDEQRQAAHVTRKHSETGNIQAVKHVKHVKLSRGLLLVSLVSWLWCVAQ